MRRGIMSGIRSLPAPFILIMCALGPIGCVSTETHTKTLSELDAAKKAAAQQASEYEALKKQSAAQAEQSKQQLAGLQRNLDEEAAQRKAAESSVSQLQGDIQQVKQQADALEKEREALKARSEDLQAKLDGLEKDKGQLNSELGDVRGQIQALEQKMASGSASAQDEIAKLQQRAKELEAEADRVGKEREQLRQEQTQLAAELEQERQRLKAEEADKARMAQEQAQLSASLDQERQRLKDEEAEKARLEKERAAKEEEIKRLTRTHEELTRSLQDEISKGNITIQQVRDRLTINMVDRVLFDSGQAVIKPAGVKVLKQVGDVLKNVTDKQIRIEGHTDNVPISVKLQDRFKTNWELSTARATTVVRYLIDHGGVDRQSLSAVGYAETHPIASNDDDAGRSANRRIEIVLYPKDLQQISGKLENGAGH